MGSYVRKPQRVLSSAYTFTPEHLISACPKPQPQPPVVRINSPIPGKQKKKINTRL
jgi:hypothetical protein